MSKRQPKPAAGDEKVLQLKISLAGSHPPIWRRVQVRESMSLAGLHHVVQIAMDWDDDHLHVFAVKGRRFSILRHDAGFGFNDEEDSHAVTLRELRLRRKGQKFRYTYDFGDNWLHEIQVEAVQPVDPNVFYPVCLTGRCAAPLEDCGGIYGYYQLLDVLQDPSHPEHEERREWVDEDFDPELFDLARINGRFRAVFRGV